MCYVELHPNSTAHSFRKQFLAQNFQSINPFCPVSSCNSPLKGFDKSSNKGTCKSETVASADWWQPDLLAYQCCLCSFILQKAALCGHPSCNALHALVAFKGHVQNVCGEMFGAYGLPSCTNLFSTCLSSHMCQICYVTHYSRILFSLSFFTKASLYSKVC